MPATLNGVEYPTLDEAVKVAKDGEVIECRGMTTVHDGFEIEMEAIEPVGRPMLAVKNNRRHGCPFVILWMRSNP